MRIAVVSPGYAPNLGGVETVVTNVSRELVRQGCQVEVWTQRRPGDPSGLQEVDGVAVRRFATTASTHYPVSPRLWAHARAHSGDFDVVHAHGYHSSAWLGMLFERSATPFVVSPHFHGVGHTAPARLLHVAYRIPAARLLQRATCLVAVSAAEEALLVRSFPGLLGRTRVIHHGVDGTALHAARPWPDEPPTLLVLGRHEQYKRIDGVIHAFDRGDADGQLVILGDGPDRLRLEEITAKARRRADIRFMGRVSDDDLRRWLRTARAIANLSEQEAFGLVALEGVAAGAQVVLSDLPAHREVAAIGGGGDQQVVVVGAGDDAGLATELDRVLRTPPGRPRPVRSWTDAAAEHLELYASILRG